VSAIVPRILNEEEAAIYLGVSVPTLQHKRPDTPVRYTKETFEAEYQKGQIVPPPFVVMANGKNGKKGYDIRELDAYIDMLPRMGQLPKEEEDQ
jgi:hypothetical protein